MSSTSSQLDSILGGVESAAIEQLRCKADIVAQGQGEIRPKDWPKKPSKDKKKRKSKECDGKAQMLASRMLSILKL